MPNLENDVNILNVTLMVILTAKIEDSPCLLLVLGRNLNAEGSKF